MGPHFVLRRENIMSDPIRQDMPRSYCRRQHKGAGVPHQPLKEVKFCEIWLVAVAAFANRQDHQRRALRFIAGRGGDPFGLRADPAVFHRLNDAAGHRLDDVALGNGVETQEITVSKTERQRQRAEQKAARREQAAKDRATADEEKRKASEAEAAAAEASAEDGTSEE